MILSVSSKPKDGASKKARKYADEQASILLKNREICKRIVTLFAVDEMHAIQIWHELKDELTLSDDAVERTKIGIIQRMVQKLIRPEFARLMRQKQNERRYENASRTIIKEARINFRKQNDEFVWLDEETDFFCQLCNDTELYMNISRGWLNHSKTSSIMNEKFKTQKFSRKNCLEKYRNVNNAEKKKKKNAELKEMRDRLIRSMLPDILSEFDDPIAVAPLVVVPPKDLQQVGTHDLSECFVEDTAAAVANDVVGDNGATFHAENSL